jgi:EmrB/QacA subfamily drug resistance transporter
MARSKDSASSAASSVQHRESPDQSKLAVPNSPPSEEAVPEKPAQRKSVGYNAVSDDEYKVMTVLERVVIMGSLCLSVFLAALDQTIIATALPTISDHFKSEAGYTWVGAAYVLGNAASVPSWGKISDIFGRKVIILIAAFLFLVGSTLSATAVSIAMLLIGRSIQGIGGGGLLVLVNIAISDMFSARARGLYYGLVGMTWAFASAFGPILGGAFTERASWRWCFYINIPCSSLCMVILFFFLKVHNPRTPLVEGLLAIDWLGSLLIVGATVMLLLGLQFGGIEHPWASAIVLCLIIFGLVTFAIFLGWEWKGAKFPVMPLGLFAHKTPIACLVVCFCHGMVFISGAFFLPLYFQAVLLATPILSGVYLLPFCFPLALGAGCTGIFIQKTGKYLPPIRVGFFFMVIGFGLLINLDRTSGWAKIIIFQIVAGIGIGPQFQAPLIALQSVVEPRKIGTATATFQFTRNIATSISIVVGGVLFQNGLKTRISQLTAASSAQIAATLTQGSPGANIGVLQGLPSSQQEAVRDIMATSLSRLWILYTVLSFVGFCATWFIGKHELSRTRHASTAQQGGVKGGEAAAVEKKEDAAANGAGAAPVEKKV